MLRVNINAIICKGEILWSVAGWQVLIPIQILLISNGHRCPPLLRHIPENFLTNQFLFVFLFPMKLSGWGLCLWKLITWPAHCCKRPIVLTMPSKKRGDTHKQNLVITCIFFHYKLFWGKWGTTQCILQCKY